MNILVLFDVDGTLVTTAGQQRSPGKSAMNEAGFEVTGKRGLAESVDFAGATDLRVAKELLVSGGVPSPSEEQKMELLNRYTDCLYRYMEEGAYRALGTPHEVIPELRRKGVHIGLATGNVRQGARFKLMNANLDSLFDISMGGYGDDAEQRVDIILTAIRRCLSSESAKVVVVGDTPHDIEAAHRAGAACIGIPWGRNSREVLLGAGADAVAGEVSEELAELIINMAGA